MSLLFSRFNNLKMIVFLIALIPLQSFAELAVCTAKIESVGLHKPGLIYLDLEGANGFILCNIQETTNGITPAACKGMFATALLAKSSGSKVNIYVDNAPSTSCSEIPSWYGADTRFFTIVP